MAVSVSSGFQTGLHVPLGVVTTEYANSLIVDAKIKNNNCIEGHLKNDHYPCPILKNLSQTIKKRFLKV